MKSVAGTVLLALLACSQTKTPPASSSQVSKESVVQDTQPKTPTPQGEYAELRRFVAKVTPAERARVKGEDERLWKTYQAAAPKPRVIFEVPARECCPSKDEACRKRHLKFAGLCYENPTRELWGLGAFAIDDDGVFWINDPVADRAVGFDRSGQVVDAVPLYGPIGLENLVVTPTEVWLDTFNPDGDHDAAWLNRVDRKTHRARAYRWQNLIGSEYQGYGWLMPGNPARIMRWNSRMSWDVVDVSFLDDTRMRISAPHPLHARGHRYWLACTEEKDPAALVIDDHAVAAPGCMQVQYVGPDGDIVAGDPFYHYDTHGNVLAIAARTNREFDMLTTGNDWTVGPDGNAYQYLPGPHSVKFVQLPWFPK
jgi:hypothetical protein